MRDSVKIFLGFAGKAALVQMVTYFVFGLIMSNIFGYGSLFQQDVIRDFMRPIDDPNIFFGFLIQPIRGLLFAIGIFPIRHLILESKRGWLILWTIFIVFGILSTPAAAPSSLEGIVYSKLPFWYHLIGLPEMLLQTLAFSLILVWWEKRQYATTQPLLKKALWGEILKAVMISAFAYMGYAVGSILSAILVRAEIDIESAAADWKTQLMFVVALVFNIVLVFFVSRRWVARKILLWQVFLLFWIIDTLVPLAYQSLFLFPMPLPIALLIGFFPALVITLGIRVGYRQSTPAS